MFCRIIFSSDEYLVSLKLAVITLLSALVQLTNPLLKKYCIFSYLGGAFVPDIAVVNVEGQTDNSQQDPQPSKDRHRHKELLGQVAKLLNDHRLVCRGSKA